MSPQDTHSEAAPDLRAAARELDDAGLCVIRIKADGTKAPDVGSWSRYKTQRTTPQQHDGWFNGTHPAGIGVITGAISGNVELLEFEGRAVAEGIHDQVADLAANSGLGDLWKLITTGWAEQSPSGGLHYKVKVSDRPVPGNRKLASRPSTPEELDQSRAAVRAAAQANGERLTADAIEKRTTKTQTLIETRGEGGYVVVAPSSGSVHATSRPYVRITGGPATMPTITGDDLDALHTLCEVMDTVPRKETSRSAPRTTTSPVEGKLRPLDDYEARTDWTDILTGHFTEVFEHGGTRYWRRAGKNRGVSATTGRDPARDRLFVFSTSTPFDPLIPYTKPGAYAHLEFDGDHRAAARELVRQGYGDQPPRRRLSLVTARQPTPSGPADGRGDGDIDGANALAPEFDLDSDPGHDDFAPPATGTATAEAAPANMPLVDISNEADAVEALLEEMRSGHLSGLYKRPSAIVWVQEDQQGNPFVRQLGTDNLRAYLAAKLATYTVVEDKDTKGTREVRALVMRQTCATLLGRPDWPLDPLRGIVTAPVVRPDKTVLLNPGYDKTTGLYLHPRTPLRRLRDEVTADAVTAAKAVVLDQMLADFPWQGESDRAQFLGALLAPIIRPLVPGPTPLIVITATSAGSGKTLLKDILEICYGVADLPWPGEETELRKAISAQLHGGGEPVVALDNLPNGTVIKSPILSGLLTAKVWRDRVLGSTEIITMSNDRLWVATGNNLRTGGDNARRALWVRLDPNCPNPDQRDGFVVGDLRQWLDDNAPTVVAALVTMVRGWLADGGKPVTTRMGDYSRWASTIAGILAYLGVPGWMADRQAALDEMDDEADEWTQLLGKWHDTFGSAPVSTGEVLRAPALGESLPRTRKDELPSTRELGHMLKARNGRFFGTYKAVMVRDTHRKQNLWKVERHEDRQTGGDQK